MTNSTAPPNESTRLTPGARKIESEPNKAQTSPGSKDFEDRRNAAACFRNKGKKEYWHADYQGVAVVEGLRDGLKIWINIIERISHRGDKYLSVVLKPMTRQ
jgi:hypothetical protein